MLVVLVAMATRGASRAAGSPAVATVVLGLLVSSLAAVRDELLLRGAVLRGVALGGLWTRDRGAWMACGANAAWTVTLGSIVQGGLVDVRFAVEPDAGLPAVFVAAAAALAASLWALAAAPARLR